MKKALCIFIAICITLTLAFTGAAADDAIKIDSGWSVLTGENPDSTESSAAKKLAETLSELFGKKIPCVSSADNKYIAVGSASKTDITEIEENGYRISAIDGNIHISGRGARGLYSGIYRFLEKFCGRKVYTAEIIKMTATGGISVPNETDIKYNPFFEYTDTDWKSPRDVEYSLANGLNGGPYRQLPAEAGGTVDYIGGFCHTMGTLCKTADFTQSDPEQLALHDGKRTADQPCLTNPKVLETATESVLNLLREKHDPDASLQIVSVTQNDNQNYCECEKCKAFEKSHGGVQSATMVNFVNQIAVKVKAEGYDNVAIDTFAYQYTRKAPENIKPEENVIIRLCTIECCFIHTLDDKSCKRNAELMEDLHDWSEICKRIYVWDYTTNYANTCIVFPDFNVIQRNIQVFCENNVRGVYEEGNYYIDSCDTEFGELRAYMISKCLQNPYCDINAEIDGFLCAYYGPGYKDIKKIIDLHIVNACKNNGGHLGIGEGPNESFRFSNAQIKEIDKCWLSAFQAAETAAQETNIKRSELSWRFWKASTGKAEFSALNPERYAEKEKLFEDMKAFGVSMISEGSYGDYLDCICIKYVPANEWNMYEDDEPAAHVRLFFEKILESLIPFLTGGGILYRLFSGLS